MTNFCTHLSLIDVQCDVHHHIQIDENRNFHRWRCRKSCTCDRVSFRHQQHQQQKSDFTSAREQSTEHGKRSNARHSVFCPRHRIHHHARPVQQHRQGEQTISAVIQMSCLQLKSTHKHRQRDERVSHDLNQNSWRYDYKMQRENHQSHWS